MFLWNNKKTINVLGMKKKSPDLALCNSKFSHVVAHLDTITPYLFTLKFDCQNLFKVCNICTRHCLVQILQTLNKLV